MAQTIKKLALLSILSIFALPVSNLAADIVVDQEQPVVVAGFGFGAGGNEGFQSVTAGLTGTLEGFEIVSNGIGLNASIMINFWVNLGPPVQGDANDFETTSTLTSSDIGTFFFVDTSTAGISLSPGDEFEIGFEPLGSFDLAIGPAGDSYSGGQFYFNGALQGRDSTFRTYVSTVPEPTSAIFVATVPVALFLRRRKR